MTYDDRKFNTQKYDKRVFAVYSARQHITYMLNTLYAIARPSVRLSVTRVYHRKTVEVEEIFTTR